MGHNDEFEDRDVFPIQSFRFEEPADHPNLTCIVFASGKNGGEPHLRFLANRAMLETLANAFLAKAKTMKS